MFEIYKRKPSYQEMRPVTEKDIENYVLYSRILATTDNAIRLTIPSVSISDADKQKGSPKIGDMIARNKNDYSDQWLIEESYFKENFENINIAKKD